MANDIPMWIKDVYYWMLKSKKSIPINKLFVEESSWGNRTVTYSDPSINGTGKYIFQTVQEYIDSLQD